MMRVHRNTFEKIIYSNAFQCDQCGRRSRRLRTPLRVKFTYLFSLHTHCLRCGSGTVERSQQRQRLDSISRSPFSAIQRLIGAPMKRCLACRLTYFDWRPPERIPSISRSDVPHSS
jgi:hypothetical protein